MCSTANEALAASLGVGRGLLTLLVLLPRPAWPQLSVTHTEPLTFPYLLHPKLVCVVTSEDGEKILRELAYSTAPSLWPCVLPVSVFLF